MGELRQYLFAAFEQAKPTRLVSGCATVLDGAALVAQYGEVSVDEPAQQVGDLSQLGGREPGATGRGVQRAGQLDNRIAHGIGIRRDVAAVLQGVR